MDLLKSFLAEISTNPLGQPAAACLDNGQFPTLRFAPIDRAAAARPGLMPLLPESGLSFCLALIAFPVEML